MNYYGKLIVCDRCGKEQFLRMKNGILDEHLKPDSDFEYPEGWRLIPSPKSDYRSMIDVCPECFSNYRYTMDQFYANTNVKKDES